MNALSYEQAISLNFLKDFYGPEKHELLTSPKGREYFIGKIHKNTAYVYRLQPDGRGYKDLGTRTITKKNTITIQYETLKLEVIKYDPKLDPKVKREPYTKMDLTGLAHMTPDPDRPQDAGAYINLLEEPIEDISNLESIGKWLTGLGFTVTETIQLDGRDYILTAEGLRLSSIGRISPIPSIWNAMTTAEKSWVLGNKNTPEDAEDDVENTIGYLTTEYAIHNRQLHEVEAMATRLREAQLNKTRIEELLK